jgi:hypothetical protein
LGSTTEDVFIHHPSGYIDRLGPLRPLVERGQFGLDLFGRPLSVVGPIPDVLALQRGADLFAEPLLDSPAHGLDVDFGKHLGLKHRNLLGLFLARLRFFSCGVGKRRLPIGFRGFVVGACALDDRLLPCATLFVARRDRGLTFAFRVQAQALGAGVQHAHPHAERRHHAEQTSGECERRLVPRHQLANLVHRAGRPGQDRLIGQVPLHVFGERGGTGVALRRCLLQRLQHDGLQVALHRRDAGDALGDRAWPARRRFANDPHHLVQHGLVRIVGKLLRQYLIEDHTQRIDVAANIDLVRVAPGLLGAHVRERSGDLTDRRQDCRHRDIGICDLGEAEVQNLRGAI